MATRSWQTGITRSATSALASAGRLAGSLPWWGWAAVGIGMVLIARPLAAVTDPGGGGGGGGGTKGPMPTIRQGDTDATKLGAVSVWQGVVGVPLTGVFDAATKAATVAWQTLRKLTPDGIVGKASWTAAGWFVGGGVAPGPSGPDFLGATPLPNSGGFQLSNNIAEREKQIEAAILDGNYEHEWAPITVSCNGHSGTFQVSRKPLALAFHDARLIVNTSFDTGHNIAEMLDAYLLTSKLADEIQRQADVIVNGQSRNWQGTGTDNSGSTTKRMVDFSDQLYDLMQGDAGLVSLLSKIWAITKKNWTNPDTAEGTSSSRHNGANHGLYSFNADGSPKEKPASEPGSTLGGLAVIQDLGLAHNRKHADYSQLNYFVRRACVVDGQTMDVADVARDPALSCLVSDEGTLPDMRHPDLGGSGGGVA